MKGAIYGADQVEGLLSRGIISPRERDFLHNVRGIIAKGYTLSHKQQDWVTNIRLRERNEHDSETT